MKKISFAAILLTAFTIAAGEPAIDRAAAGMNVRELFEMRNYGKFSAAADDGKPVFFADGFCELISRQSFEIKPGMKYRVSVKARAVGGQPSFIMIGIAPYDARGRLISDVNLNGADQTLTELTRPCARKDKVIYVKDASLWLGANRGAAFDAKADRSDLPNFNVPRSRIVSIEEVEEDGSWQVTFNYPVGFDRPAGTAVRMHRFGGTYHYTRSADVPEEWTVFTGQDFSSSRFRKGTVTGRAVILCNYGKGAQSDLYFDELTVEELPAE